MSELIDAVRASDVRTVQALLAGPGTRIVARDDDGTSVVLVASAAGDRRVLDALLAAGPDLDVFDAAALGLVNQLEILLGLDPTLAMEVGPGGTTALHLAARFGHGEAARRLLDAGADPAWPDGQGRTAADVAYTSGHAELVVLLRPS